MYTGSECVDIWLARLFARRARRVRGTAAPSVVTSREEPASCCAVSSRGPLFVVVTPALGPNALAAFVVQRAMFECHPRRIHVVSTMRPKSTPTMTIGTYVCFLNEVLLLKKLE